MITKEKAPARAAVPFPAREKLARSASTTPLTTEERLQRIQAMGLRIEGYIQFMCQVATLNGASGETRERAITAFYEQMIVVEGQLCRIQEDFRLE